MENISFTSRLKPITLSEFRHTISSIGSQNSVDFPWSINQTRKGKDVYTTNVIDCSSCLITNGQEAVLMHLTPDTEQNHAFSLVLAKLRNLLDLKDSNLQAVLLGSKNHKKSLDIYNKFKELLKQLNIPFSEFKNGKTPTSIAYKTSSDEVYITNNTIDKLLKKNMKASDTLNASFENLTISSCDEIA